MLTNFFPTLRARAVGPAIVERARESLLGVLDGPRHGRNKL